MQKASTLATGVAIKKQLFFYLAFETKTKISAVLQSI
jgi:hypothetical protein